MIAAVNNSGTKLGNMEISTIRADLKRNDMITAINKMAIARLMNRFFTMYSVPSRKTMLVPVKVTSYFSGGKIFFHFWPEISHQHLHLIGANVFDLSRHSCQRLNAIEKSSFLNPATHMLL